VILHKNESNKSDDAACLRPQRKGFPTGDMGGVRTETCRVLIPYWAYQRLIFLMNHSCHLLHHHHGVLIGKAVIVFSNSRFFEPKFLV